MPNALPFIFAGLNVALVFSILGAIVGEFVGSKDGVGFLILDANYQLD
ncbi:ABC transporter permease subunit, partial [Vibrio parahaemolyticus]